MFIYLFFIVIILVGIKTGLFKLLFNSVSGTPAKEQKLPYKKKDYLLTVAEKNFYQVLKQVSDKNNFLLFAKVRLEDLLWLPAGIERKDRFGLRGRIKSRHVDFVLCDKQNIKPLLVIELDDSSHNTQKGIERDDFVDRALRDAGLSILHQKVQYSYDLQGLEEKISRLAI
jgi:very-short-patch-repair endonuclease